MPGGGWAIRKPEIPVKKGEIMTKLDPRYGYTKAQIVDEVNRALPQGEPLTEDDI